MGRGITIALFASLALNIFSIGFIAGQYLTDDTEASPPDRVVLRGAEKPFRLMRHAGRLPPESRDAFRQAIRSELPSLREHHQELRKLRNQLSAQLASDDWDRNAVEETLSQISEAHHRQRAATDQTFLKAFGSLSSTDRQTLIEASRQQEARWREGREHRERRRLRRRGEMNN